MRQLVDKSLQAEPPVGMIGGFPVINGKEGIKTADIKSKIQSIYSLEQLSGNTTCIHRLHPVVKVLSTVVFIVSVVSFGRYDLGRLIPFFFYPAIVMALSETPYPLLLKRMAVALPFCLFAGVSNLIFDTGTAGYIGGLAISYGFVSLLAILLKTGLCVMAALLLVAATPISALSGAMRTLRVPAIFITLFEMTYRYIGTLLEETASMYTAYMLRGTQQKGVELKHMGGFVGLLLLRSFDRSERVYDAMKCRGYALRESRRIRQRTAAGDWIFLICVCGFSVLFRAVDVTGQLTRLIG